MIKIAIVGVGNCANALVQGLNYYKRNSHTKGLMMSRIGPYGPEDIQVVAAFDVAASKVGVPLNTAIWAEPNDTFVFASPIRGEGVIVARGPTIDGFGEYLYDSVPESIVAPCDVVRKLKDSGAKIVVNYLPVGSEKAAMFYASAALQADCAFINCMPTFIASNPERETMFRKAGLPIIGDDIKSQVGATIVHRALATLMRDRGITLLRTAQLNVGGNSDFLNMLERSRLISKKISKTQAVTSVMGVALPKNDVHVGPSDHVPWLTDRKWAYITLEAEGFGGAPMSIEVKMEVWDSPNSAGIVMDAIRCAAIARDRGLGGAILEPSAWYMKSPPVQVDDDVAHDNLIRFIGNGHK